MKLIKSDNEQLAQAKEVPGLLSFRVDYEVKSAKGQLKYTGPKFTPEMWHQVLSFFRWTYKEMRSESQVRLYVNTKVKRWGAWAFPQQARTGMNAREIAVTETPEQAEERFASWDSEPSDDWLYFCTVHHHCSASAFQSSVDEENEKNQDGLHITVGRMDADRHDLHARFYVGGNCFDPDMSAFWPIEPELVQRVPEETLDEIARFQMSEKVTVDFPDAWRKNVIDIKPEPRKKDADMFPEWEHERRSLEMSGWGRAEAALAEVFNRCAAASIAEDECLSGLQRFGEDAFNNIIIETCIEYDVTPRELLEEVVQIELPY